MHMTTSSGDVRSANDFKDHFRILFLTNKRVLTSAANSTAISRSATGYELIPQSAGRRPCRCQSPDDSTIWTWTVHKPCRLPRGQTEHTQRLCAVSTGNYKASPTSSPPQTGRQRLRPTGIELLLTKELSERIRYLLRLQHDAFQRSLTEEEEVKQLEAGDESRSGPTDTEHFVSGAAGEPSSHSEQQDLAVTPGPSASSQTTTSVPRECRQNKSFKDFDH
ncbi:hypothetical protein PC118_g14612 [Phytophthora cactorum]|uniref:Uncharacterized protein n=2 Tax=Phytophthora cactorum TaxID=29920 RepID=A0A8T1FNT0_9STRA|nr:hypothetical protein PC112_g15939 [Phytophthora cactorum]KAG2855883.1 hypothetical protein PC113_g12059 [Phytophthora cactorum]KAG2878094.1 hypothetical protein PC114_g23291 [Phytophthora cactorum]KAG2974297.1 hypothetical protein PC118_g14612 [Phytophthora cactorum]